jgi:hypothetical protein
MKKFSCSIALLAVGLLLAPTAKVFAQVPLTMPQPSQKAQVMQRIGLTDVTITYHSPQAKGRNVWGRLVPYNEVWRAGANENTTIQFTHDVSIEGKPLAAGTYGLHMIPTDKDWTVIFSKNSNAWGSYFYKPEEDALRVTVKPQPAETQDWLSYSFNDRQANSAVAVMTWDKVKVPVKIGVDVDKVVLENMRKELTGPAGFNPAAFQNAANYALTHNSDLNEAMAWVQQSINMQEGFGNLRVKSAILAKQGETKEADAMLQRAMAIADEPQLNAYGYQLLGERKTAEALAIFKENAKRHPNSWNVYDSLAECLQNMNEKKQALTNYKQALAKAPVAQKARLEKTIAALGS